MRVADSCSRLQSTCSHVTPGVPDVGPDHLAPPFSDVLIGVLRSRFTPATTRELCKTATTPPRNSLPYICGAPLGNTKPFRRCVILSDKVVVLPRICGNTNFGTDTQVAIGRNK